MKKLIILMLMSLLAPLCSVKAQTTIIGNNTTSSTDFLGWNGNTGIDLHVQHGANKNIVFHTNNIAHAGLLGNGIFLTGTPTPIDGGLISIGTSGASSAIKYGLFSAINAIGVCYGGHFSGANAPINVGLAARVNSTTTSFSNVAIYGRTCGIDFGAGIMGYIGECPGSSWAGYFDGPTFCSGGIWTGSDENLKTSIEPLTSGMGILNSLSPKQYNFINPEGVEITLPQGLQYGLIAQELQLVIPHAVTNVTHGQKLEAMRAGEIQDFSFLGVNYSQLIPVLIKAFQERQAEINAHEEELLLMQLLIEEAELSMALLMAE
jgi:hypothetical protein